jgi:hypothetical protein
VKSRSQFRLLAVPLLTAMLFGCVPSLDAAVLNSPLLTLIKIVKEKQKEKEDEKKKKATVPEGSSGAALVLAASALGGALLISRRKRSAKAA